VIGALPPGRWDADQERADDPRLRLAIIGIVVISLFVALFARLWFLQVLSAEDYQAAAAVNAVRTVTEPAPRGRILDRNGVVLVDNRASNVVAVDRTRVEGRAHRERLLSRLAPVLDVPAATLEARLDDPRVDRLVPVPLATNVSDDVMAHLRERQEDFPAVVARRTAVRHYPHGTLAAHVLGYVGEINGDELAGAGDRYRPGDRIGKAGIERAFEDDLRGVDGEVRYEVDASGDPVRVVGERPPVPGHDVVLALDVDAQHAAEEALAEGLVEARTRTWSDTGQPLVADAGAVVALDAVEGTVVAMASYPTFDPRELVHRVSPEQAEFLFGDASGAPFTNRATQGVYAPGSTWKLVTASAAMQAGLVDEGTTIVDRGTYRIPGCTRDCTKRNAGGTAYGVVDLRRAMSVSSDVYFYDLGARFWDERGRLGDTPIQDEARRLGVGERSGVELGGEQEGRLATPASRRALHESNPEAYPEGNWFVGANVNLSIGQGELTVTPVQLANLYAAFATAERHAPNLALRIERARDGERHVVRTVEPRLVAEVATAPEVREPIMDGLRRVVTDPGGTAHTAFEGWPHDAAPVAGKTGTAQTGGKQDTALFAAVAPADDPRYAVSVVMEQSGFGSTAAAPVARRVLGVLMGVEGSSGSIAGP
jgi:penicillin-binding protein 2